MNSPSRESRDVNGRLAASLGVAKESAATKLYRAFQDKALGARAAKDAHVKRLALVQQSLSSHWACKTLTAERMKPLLAGFEEVVFAPTEKITQAGEHGEFFYLIEDGEVEIVLEGDLMLQIALPDQLGGGKSTVRQPREVTPEQVIQHMVKIRATTTNVLFELILIEERGEKVLPLSTPLSIYAVGTDRLVLRVQVAPETAQQDKARPRSSTNGQKQPDEKEEGSQRPRPTRQRIESLHVLERGACFGELGLLFGTTRFHTARARTGRPVRCLAFHRELMQTAFAGSPIFPCVAVLRTSPILCHLSTWHLARVAAALKPCVFQAGEVLLPKFGVLEDLSVIPDGTVRENSVESKALQLYGDVAVFMPLPEISQWDIVAETSGLVCRLPKTQLMNVLGTEYQRLQDRVVQRDEESRARQRAWREEALSSHWLLGKLGIEARKGLVDHMFARHAEDGSSIVMQGQRADFCYVLEQGKAEVWESNAELPANNVGKEGCLIRTLQPGAVFGELAIMFNAKRSVTITAKGPALVQCIPDHVLLTALQGISLYEQALFLQQCECAAGLGTWDLFNMAQTLQSHSFKPGEVLFKQGDTATRFYLLEKGEAQSLVDNKVVETYKPGQQFGEAVATDVPHPHSVVAVTAISTLFVDKVLFQTEWRKVLNAIKDRERMAARAKRLRRKGQVMDEFVQSESLYVSFLHILIDEFLNPLRTILNESQIQRIFSNLEMLCEFHDHIIGELTPSTVGAVLVKYADSLQCYTPYVRNFDDAGEMVKTLSKSHKGFQKFLADKREHPEAVGGLDILSYLIMPVQRIPRYRMLLEEIFRFSDADDRDTAEITSALAKIKAVALGVNEAKRQCEEEEALAKMANSIIGKLPITLIAPHRKVVTELDNMMPSNKKLKGPFRLVVFNDLLVVVKQENSHFRGLFEFSACSVHILENVLEKKPQGVSMVPLLSSGLASGDRPGVSLSRANTSSKDVELFSDTTPCAFVFTQSSPEQISRAKKLVDAAREWSKDD